MKTPYKLEPSHTLVPLDHEQFVVAAPEAIEALVEQIQIRNDADFIRTDALLGNLVADKKTVEERYEGPVKSAHKAHKNLTSERNEALENYQKAESLLKEKMKGYSMARDRKALAEPEVTTTSITPPELRSKLKHTSFSVKWKYKITEPDQLPREYMEPNRAMISKQVNAMGEMTRIPGVTVHRDDIVTVRT